MKKKRVSIDVLKEGDILAEDAIDIFGGVLFSEGEELTEKDILLMKSWGIREVVIRDIGDEVFTLDNLMELEKEEDHDEGDNNSILNKRILQIEEKFSDVCHHPIMRRIKEIVISQLKNEQEYESQTQKDT